MSDGFFVIARVSRDDLQSDGYDITNVSDDTMRELAERLGDSYVENSFWLDLLHHADALKIPRA